MYVCTIPVGISCTVLFLVALLDPLPLLPPSPPPPLPPPVVLMPYVTVWPLAVPTHRVRVGGAAGRERERGEVIKEFPYVQRATQFWSSSFLCAYLEPRKVLCPHMRIETTTLVHRPTSLAANHPPCLSSLSWTMSRAVTELSQSTTV